MVHSRNATLQFPNAEFLLPLGLLALAVHLGASVHPVAGLAAVEALAAVDARLALGLGERAALLGGLCGRGGARAAPGLVGAAASRRNAGAGRTRSRLGATGVRSWARSRCLLALGLGIVARDEQHQRLGVGPGAALGGQPGERSQCRVVALQGAKDEAHQLRRRDAVDRRVGDVGEDGAHRLVVLASGARSQAEAGEAVADRLLGVLHAAAGDQGRGELLPGEGRLLEVVDEAVVSQPQLQLGLQEGDGLVDTISLGDTISHKIVL